MTTTDDVEIERRAGGPASRAGKREAVLRALAATADRGERRSDRAIAKLCGVSQPFVSKLRRSLDAPPKKDTQLNDTDVNAVLEDTGIDHDVAAAAHDPLIETREEHARFMADSVRGATLLPGGLLPGGDEPDDTGGALPPVPTHTLKRIARLTDSPRSDAHATSSPDGQWMAFSSVRGGFKDEAALNPGNPQASGDLYVMRADGTDVRALTDNPFEEATPGWAPVRRPGAR